MQTIQVTDFEVIAQGFEFVEGPRVSPEGDIWFADLTGKGVYRRRRGSDVEEMLPGRQWVGGILFDESGLVLCSGRGGIVALEAETGRTRSLVSSIEGQPVIAVNDMEGDGRGGFYAGTIDFVSALEKGEAPSPGQFFHMAASGEITVLRRDVYASNGIAASPCGKWLYHSETMRGIWRYPRAADGVPGDGELFIEIEDSDGLVVDAEGNLWVACWSTGRLLHYSPERICLKALSFPYPHIVSIDFGASDPSRLVISTGGNANVPQAGAVLELKVDVPGLPGPLTRLKGLEAGL